MYSNYKDQKKTASINEAVLCAQDRSRTDTSFPTGV